jgi:hypothetical protein
MSKATPGPWHYGPSSALEGGFIIQGSYENGGGPRLPILGRTHNFPNNAEANARLIAAAPDLLEALKQCTAVLAGDTMHKGGLVAALEAARAALLKAQGR